MTIVAPSRTKPGYWSAIYEWMSDPREVLDDAIAMRDYLNDQLKREGKLSHEDAQTRWFVQEVLKREKS